jgi:hypothetical protein
MISLVNRKTYANKLTETEDLVDQELIRQLKEQKMRTGLYPYY